MTSQSLGPLVLLIAVHRLAVAAARPRIKACPGLDPGSGAGFVGIMLCAANLRSRPVPYRPVPYHPVLSHPVRSRPAHSRQTSIAVPDRLCTVVGHGVRPGRGIPILSHRLSYLITIGSRLSQGGIRQQQGNSNGNEDQPDHVDCFLSSIAANGRPRLGSASRVRTRDGRHVTSLDIGRSPYAPAGSTGGRRRQWQVP
jgi:hypothetical protein